MKINSAKNLLWITFLILAVVGCHSSPEENNNIRIAYIAKIPQKSFHDSILFGIQKTASKHRLHVDFFPAENQRDIQTQKVRLQKISQENNYAGVILAPNDSLALLDDVRLLDNAGIWFIVLDTPLLDLPSNEILTHNCGFVGTDNVLAGRMAARFIISELHDGNILMMRGNHSQKTSIDRENGFFEELKKYDQFKIISYLSGYWEMDPAFNAISNYMKSSPKMPDAVFAYSDSMAIGVSKYYKSKEFKQRPVIVGVDGVLLGQQAVLEGKIDASVVQAPEVMGETALKNLIMCINNNHSQNVNILTPVTLLKASRTLEVVNP